MRRINNQYIILLKLQVLQLFAQILLHGWASDMQCNTCPTSNETVGQGYIGYAMGDAPHKLPRWDGQTTTCHKEDQIAVERWGWIKDIETLVMWAIENRIRAQYGHGQTSRNCTAQIASCSALSPRVCTKRGTSNMQGNTYPINNETRGGQWDLEYAMWDSPHNLSWWDGQATTLNKEEWHTIEIWGESMRSKPWWGANRIKQCTSSIREWSTIKKL